MDTINNIVRKLRENRILNEREDYTEKSRDELIMLAQSGDQLAIETLMSTHKDFLGRMRAKYVMDNWDKDDIAQMTMIAFWEAIQSYDPARNGDFEAYAGMIIKRRLTDELRKEEAGKRKINTQAKSLDDTQSDSEGSETTFGDTIADTGLSPEEAYASKEAEEAIRKYMEERLSPVELDIVKRKIAGDKVSQIAEDTGMKYKSVENALMRVKNKLADYMRTRESKKIEESEDAVDFTDEEKAILKNALSKMHITENHIMSHLRESYENYTEDQLDDELTDIEYEIGMIFRDLVDTPYNDREEHYSRLQDLKSKLYAMEEFMTTEQNQKSDELLDQIRSAEDVEYDGKDQVEDPYAERGLSPSDFY